jgi:hypothetical protein
MAEVIRKHAPDMAEYSSILLWDDYHSAIGNSVARSVFPNPFLLPSRSG